MGCTIIAAPRIHRRSILEGLTHKPSVFLGVPALYGLMCLLKTADLSSVEYFISGGDALPDKIRLGFALVYQRKLCSGYGLSETSPVISVDMDDEIAPTSCVGRPMQGIEVAFRDEKGNNVAQGAIGTIWVKGPMVMLGYYNAPELTQSVIKDGWFDTGDLGHLDMRGRIIITGRIKDLLLTKG